MQYEYDGTHEKCPLPLVKTRLILKKMRPEDSCILRIADTGSKNDIPKLLTKHGYSFSQTNVSASVVELIIKIGK